MTGNKLLWNDADPSANVTIKGINSYTCRNTEFIASLRVFFPSFAFSVHWNNLKFSYFHIYYNIFLAGFKYVCKRKIANARKQRIKAVEREEKGICKSPIIPPKWCILETCPNSGAFGDLVITEWKELWSNRSLWMCLLYPSYFLFIGENNCTWKIQG